MVGENDLERMLTVNIVDIGDAVFTVDGSQRIVAWNAAAERLLGYSMAEVVGHRCHDVLACGERPAALCRAHCAHLGKLESRPLPPVHVTLRTRDGDSRCLAMSTLLARTASGRPRLVHFLREVPGYTAQPPTAERPRPQWDEPRFDTPLDHSVPEPHLTPRELEALRLLARGFSTVEIASSLGVSRITARNHVTKVMDKLQVRTRLQAVVVASRRGLL